MSPIERTADRAPERTLVPAWRIWAVAALLCAGMAAMVVKAARLQLVLGDDLRELAEDQYLRRLKVTAPRGAILDREGKPLAVSVAAWSIYADPRMVEDKGFTAKALGEILSLPRATILERVSTERGFVWLDRRVSPDVAEKVRALDLPGIGLRREMRRYYPMKELAGQLLGQVTIDGDGVGGVEQAFDAHLQGRSQTLPALSDNKGRKAALTTGLDVSLLEGDDVALTISSKLQHVAEEAVLAAVREHKAKAGYAVVMDPKTGDLLAVANVPLYNPNAPESTAGRRNRVFSDAIEPGSTFKLATFAAALDAGVLRPQDEIFCENGRFQLGRHVIRDVHKEGWLTATQVLAESSNIGTLKIAQRVGEDAFKEAVKRYGFGSKPGTDLVEESAGRLPSQARWGEARLATISFGHGLAVTPLQMIAFTSAIANGGVLLRPRVVERVTSGTGEIVFEAGAPRGERIMSVAAARTLAQMMTSVVTDGTGLAAAIPGVHVAGKTGTAEKVDPVTRRYSRELHLSSFIGFAPVEDPKVVAFVVIDEPQGNVYGGATAGPPWRKIVEAALLDQGLLGEADLARAAPPPPEPKKGAKAAPAPPAPPAQKPALADVGVEKPAAAAAEDAPIDLLGKTAREALVLAEQRGLLVEMTGSGVVVAQDPKPGRKLAAGAVVKLKLAEAP